MLYCAIVSFFLVFSFRLIFFLSTLLMAPKKSIASSYKSKQARIEGTSPDPTVLDILPFPERLSMADCKLVTGRESLKMIIEKSFDEEVIDHLMLEELFVGLD